jgi:hypothetical protein
MGMNTLTTDNSLWMKFTENILEGISGVYVDDVVQDGTAEFGRLTNQLSVNYDAKANIYGDIRIADIEFQRDKYGIRVNQSQYLRSLRPLPTDASYKDFRSARMKLMRVSAFEAGCGVLCCISRANNSRTVAIRHWSHPPLQCNHSAASKCPGRINAIPYAGPRYASDLRVLRCFFHE